MKTVREAGVSRVRGNVLVALLVVGGAAGLAAGLAAQGLPQTSGQAAAPAIVP